MGDCIKKDFRCGKPIQYAACVKYGGTLPDYSALDNCSSVEDVLEEHYDLITEIRDNIDLSDLGDQCITYPTETLTVAQALLAMETFICAQNELITTMQGQISVLQAQVADLQSNICPE